MILSKNKKGFTLVELLVVTAIIGVLAAIVFSKVKRYIQRAREAKAITIINMTAKACQIYSAQFGEYPHYIVVRDNPGWGPDAYDGGSILIDEIKDNMPGPILYGEKCHPENPVFPNRATQGDRVWVWNRPLETINDPDPLGIESINQDYNGWVYFGKDGQIRLNSNAISSDGVTPLSYLPERW